MWLNLPQSAAQVIHCVRAERRQGDTAHKPRFPVKFPTRVMRPLFGDARIGPTPCRKRVPERACAPGDAVLPPCAGTSECNASQFAGIRDTTMGSPSSRSRGRFASRAPAQPLDGTRSSLQAGLNPALKFLRFDEADLAGSNLVGAAHGFCKPKLVRFCLRQVVKTFEQALCKLRPPATGKFAGLRFYGARVHGLIIAAPNRSYDLRSPVGDSEGVPLRVRRWRAAPDDGTGEA